MEIGSLDLHDLADLLFRHVHLLGQRRRIGLGAGFLQDLAADPVHLVDRFDHVHRDADGARLVGDRAGDGLADPPRGVGRELVAAAVFELVHRLHQADVAFLDQVEELQAAVGVFLGDRDDQAQVGLGHFALGATGLGFAGGHLLVDVLQLLERDADAVLQGEQLLLLFLDRRRIARQDRRVGLAGRRRFRHRPSRDSFRCPGRP
jgi:hypothetical protein